MSEYRVTNKHVFFWGSFLSNFEPCYICYNDDGTMRYFTSSEQMFMYFKAKHFGDTERMEQILAAKTPKEAKKLGREVRGFDDAVWAQHRMNYMYEAVRAKFNQNGRLLVKLLDKKFDNKTFVEASPYDRIWGIGMGMNDPGVDNENNWKGMNLLGKIITNIRQKFKDNILL